MYRLILAIGFLFVVLKGTSQHNYKQVDSLSFALYEKENWKDLANFGQTIAKEDFDYYLLNLRLGIANYNIKNYDDAIVFFEKALKNDSTSQVAIDYLVWANYYKSDFDKADYYYTKLDKEHQDKSLYEPFKKFDFIYYELGMNFQQKQHGIKQSKQSESLPYTNIGLSYHVNRKLNLYSAYYFQNQRYPYNDIELSRGFLKFEYKLKPDFILDIGLNLFHSHNAIDYANSYTYSETQEDVEVYSGVFFDIIKNGEVLEKNSGSSDEQAYAAVFGVTKLFDKLKIKPFVEISYNEVESKTVYTQEGIENVVYRFENEEIYNKDFPIESEEDKVFEEAVLQIKTGLNTGYSLTDKLGIGLELSTDFEKFHYIPSLLYKVTERLSFLAEYIAKDNEPLYYYSGSQLINTHDKMQRYSLQTQFKLSKKIQLYFVGQHDNVILSDKNIQSNTGLLGLKINL